MKGTVGILNVGAGDMRISFDPADPAERTRAARIVRDMLRRGYALLVETGKGKDGAPVFERALDFREDTCEYVIADLDLDAASGEPREPDHIDPGDPGRGRPRKNAGRRATKLVAAEGTRAVSVPRSAGG